MKRNTLQLIGLITLFALPLAAQQDFYNDYVITISGTGNPQRDPNCGSGYYFDLVMENNDRISLVPFVRVAGRGLHPVNGQAVFSSENKVIGLYIWSKNQRRRWGRCSGHESGRVFALATPIYPCLTQQLQIQWGYAFDFIVTIQPLANRITASASLINDNVNRNDVSCSLTGIYRNGPSQFYLRGGANPWSPSGTMTANGNTAMSLPITELQSLTLNTTGRIRSGWFRIPFSTSNQLFINNPSVLTDTTYRFTIFPNAAPSSVRVTIDKINFGLRYLSGIQQILPWEIENRVTLLGPAGNPASFYHWVYSEDGVIWRDLPPQFQGQHRIDISGYDLMGYDFWRTHGTNVFFKIIVDCNGAESSILTLDRRISAPNIVSVTPYPDRCFDRPNDGALRVVFDRALLVDDTSRESLTLLAVDGQDNTLTRDQIIDVTLDSDSSFTWPRRLPSDRTYVLKLLGTFKGVNTYSDHPTFHNMPFELIRPRPVTSVVTGQNVHCHGGSDGVINLVAEGGVGNYRFSYLPPGATDSLQITFSGGATHTLDFLPAGRYGFKIKDSNGCVDAARSRTIDINEPVDSLHVAFAETTDPLAYNYKDGYIETILDGGTPFGDGSYTVNWYDPINLLPDSLYRFANLAQGYQASIDSLGDGRYVLQAFDSQYARAHPDHRAGCTVTSDTLRLVEPPPLLVSIAEWRYVSCFGEDDGELVAHAKGGVPLVDTQLPYQYEWLKDNNGAIETLTQQDSIAIQLRRGIYRVRITDRNRISRLSSPFTLVEPDLLVASMTTTPVSCASGRDGTARITAQGGTTPYSFDWSDGWTQTYQDDMIEGRYFVFIKDIRDCTTTAQGSISSPFPLRVDSLLTPPQCNGYTNGSIDITVFEGTPDYTYRWGNGETTEDITGLPAGTYTVGITDRNQCNTFRRYTLADPDPVQVNLGRDRILCNNQTFVVDATIADPLTRYQWVGPNGLAHQESRWTITDEGLYQVTVTDSHQCQGSDDILIRRVAVDIASEFIVSTQAFTNNTVTLVNISQPEPDSVTWWSPSGNLRILSESLKKAELVFLDTGSYPVYMLAYRQGCELQFSKNVAAMKGTYRPTPGLSEAMVEKFNVYPNPSTSNFSVEVRLREPSSVRIRIVEVGTSIMVSDRQMHNNKDYELPYTLNLSPGTYYLLLETASESYIQRMVIY